MKFWWQMSLQTFCVFYYWFQHTSDFKSSKGPVLNRWGFSVQISHLDSIQSWKNVMCYDQWFKMCIVLAVVNRNCFWIWRLVLLKNLFFVFFALAIFYLFIVIFFENLSNDDLKIRSWLVKLCDKLGPFTWPFFYWM